MSASRSLSQAAPQVSTVDLEQRDKIGEADETRSTRSRFELEHGVVDEDPAALDSLERALVEAAERWAVHCAASRRVDV